MQIIFDKHAAENLSEKYTVLELETHHVEDKVLETWCVVPSEKIPLEEVTMLDHWKKLHGEFVQANKNKNGKLCRDLSEYLIGKWGGELDEFYQIVCGRYDMETSTK